VRTAFIVASLFAAQVTFSWLVAPRVDSGSCGLLARSHPDKKAHAFYLKSEQLLCLVQGGEVLWHHQASHGRTDGKKLHEGDNRTPEGRYALSPARKSKRFGLFLPISYPNAQDIEGARKLGKSAGGAVGIHGPQSWYAFLGNAQALINHSDGCIVLDEEGIREIADLVKRPIGIEIFAELPAQL
jgi:murein L,D-transpeptidase YafK